MITYRMDAFDGQNRIERTGLDADTARRFRNNCEAAFYRVTLTDERTGQVVTL